MAARGRGRSHLGVRLRYPNARVVTLPGTAAYVPPDAVRHPDYVPAAARQSGDARAGAGRAAGARAAVRAAGARRDRFRRTPFVNSLRQRGKAAAVFQVRSGDGKAGPLDLHGRRGRTVSDTWRFRPAHRQLRPFRLRPERLPARLSRAVARRQTNLDGRGTYQAMAVASVWISKTSARHTAIRPWKATAATSRLARCDAGELASRTSLSKSYGWYDFIMSRPGQLPQQLAGHVESGTDSMSDPALGATI